MLRLVMCSMMSLAVGMSATAAATPDSSSAGASDSAGAASPAPKPAAAAPAAKTPATSTATARQVAVLTTSLGKIVIKLRDKEAPKTTANFKKLVREKFYDGTTFHRVIPGFMIQGGDPNSKNADPGDDGTGGPGYTVAAEIKLPHLRGSVATARQGDQVNPRKDSSGSQFFIDVAPQPSLDAGGYTVFGEVIAGMDVVDKIVAFGSDPSLPTAGGGGRNPGKKALIVHATLEPQSKWEKPAEAPNSAK